jgi:hypothetical protein
VASSSRSILPAGIDRWLKGDRYVEPISDGAPTYLSTILKYLAAKVIVGLRSHSCAIPLPPTRIFYMYVYCVPFFDCLPSILFVIFFSLHSCKGVCATTTTAGYAILRFKWLHNFVNGLMVIRKNIEYNCNVTSVHDAVTLLLQPYCLFC